MCNCLLKMAFLVAWPFTAALQQTQSQTASPAASDAPAPASAASTTTPKINPVHPSPQSQARAKAIYGYDCSMCHGANGDGKGDINADGKMKLRDLRDPASLKDFSDGDIYTLIAAGKGDAMPPEEGRAKPEELWNLVIYLRAFAKPAPAAHP